MPRTCTSPRFTEANKLFMYRLLRDQLGCGKQTFITRVEEVLAQDRLAAEDLGFDSTLQLLEELGPDVVKITLFKGGRAYATIQVREDWDKALAAPESKTPTKGNKPWKKKKGDKSIKPSCPKRVKREAAVLDIAPSDKDEGTKSAPATRDDAFTNASEAPSSAMPDSTSISAGSSNQKSGETRKATPRDPRLRNANFSLEDPEASELGASKDETKAGDEAKQSCVAPEAAPIPDETSEGAGKQSRASENAGDSPHIALTVTYDPYTGQQGESSLVATAEELARRAAEKAAAEAARRAAQEATAAAARAAQIARERRAAVIAAAIAERAAKKEAEAARERAEAEANIAAMEETVQQGEYALEGAKQGGSTVPDLTASAEPAQDEPPRKEVKLENSPTIDANETLGQNAIRAAGQDAPATADELEPSSPAPALPSDFPLDFSNEVFCPGPLLHALTMLYPYGADVMGIISEYCLIARERGTIEASRSKATFSICYLQDGHRATANVVIRRRREVGMGAAWAIDSVAVAEIDDAE